MMSYTEYSYVLAHPDEKRIRQILNMLDTVAVEIEQDIAETMKILDYYKDMLRRNSSSYQKETSFYQDCIQFKRKELKKIEHRMEKLVKLQRKSKEQKIIANIICGICNLETEGLQIPDTPIKICLKCIYSTVLEHNTKVDWVAQQNKTVKEN